MTCPRARNHNPQPSSASVTLSTAHHNHTLGSMQCPFQDLTTQTQRKAKKFTLNWGFREQPLTFSKHLALEQAPPCLRPGGGPSAKTTVPSFFADPLGVELVWGLASYWSANCTALIHHLPSLVWSAFLHVLCLVSQRNGRRKSKERTSRKKKNLPSLSPDANPRAFMMGGGGGGGRRADGFYPLSPLLVASG